MAEATRKMILGLSLRYLGYHNKAWRHPTTPSNGSTSFSYHLQSAQRAEAAKLHMIFYADGLAIRAKDTPPGFLVRDMKNVDLDPFTLLPALAARTERIGLIATASTTYNEPYHLARRVSTLDHISNGRAGWNVVTSWSQQEAWNFGREEHLGKDERYERAEEFVEVVLGLWNSWERDAFLHDKETGIFYDERKLHILNHKGKHFSVRGPLTCPYSPQGRPIVVQAGGSPKGMAIGGKHADVIYANYPTIEDAVSGYRSLKTQVANYGREPDHVKVLPGIAIFTGTTRQEAQDKFDALQALVDDVSALGLSTTAASMTRLRMCPV
ncbi:NtaA/DmoA family FMN-dependent monooxygenase [Bosea lathyri]|uniref:FMN-dependent oxidoreductase, nitrilotriacetate monooxygenase family n=1 Tax=Bosea lathyri TaxID=1036778 RepID=A0A1H6CUP3_9HYPH|nr:NtaA/DmoA family FMN-dependent monooxygenase [Bosea lathyri]SEG76791.1 FMN-dependent oxidoreductase, nitrilotriacetate monooxygenase family [Bosea lathyri]